MSVNHHVCLSLLSTCQQRSRDILVCCDGRALDTEAFINRVSEVSRGLSACDVRPGDVVLLAGWNTDHMLASLLGCMDAGAIATPVNHRWSAPELMLAMQLTQPALAIVDQHCHELVQQACNSLPAAMRLQLLTAPGGTCLLCFTSGTTGRPKAVALTHASLNHASLAKLAAVGYSQTDTYLHLAPLFHVGAISSALACLMTGAAHVLLPRFNPHHALHLMQEHGVTAFIAVPTIMQDLVRAAASAPAAASCPPSCVASRPAYPPSPSPTPPITPMLTVRLILLGAGATTPQLQVELFRVFPAARVMSAYGMTEASSSITFLSITSPCKHGQLHSVQPCITEHMSCHAQQVLTPSGWLSTGDVGFLDPTGCLWLRGRAKDMIKTGGENVFAAEVEAALVSHPSVKAAAVVGIPDARLGETVAALLVLQPGWQWKGHTAGLPGAAATEELEEAMSSCHVINSLDVQDHCRNVVQLSPYKLPRVIVALAPNVELPCTTSGKVMKAPVKAAVLAARANPLSKL
ncbi:hypothetical protein V8C86DRAFT_1784688 [Haematococcus lacustris]